MKQNIRVILILLNIALYGFVATNRVLSGSYSELNSILLIVALIFTSVILFFAKKVE